VRSRTTCIAPDGEEIVRISRSASEWTDRSRKEQHSASATTLDESSACTCSELRNDSTAPSGVASTPDRFECPAHFSAGVYLSVLCRDESPFMDPSALRRATRMVPGLAVALGANPYPAACPTWKVPPAAPTVHAPVGASVPVLTVSGRFDPFSPPRLTDELGRSLVNFFPIDVPA
jgi:TAP-like protein